jgi:RNA polymerase sigma factor (sigma-70 family)
MIKRDAFVAGQERAGGRSGSERQTAFIRPTDRQLLSSYRLAALLLGSAVEAQDATHDAAVIAWERFASLRDPDRFDAWFQRILVNLCRDRLRSRPRVRFLSIDVAPEPRAIGGDSNLGERDALRRSLLTLTPGQRTVVVLRYFADLSLENASASRPSPIPSIQTSLLTAIPSRLGQIEPGVCIVGVRAYIVTRPPEKAVRAAPATPLEISGLSSRLPVRISPAASIRRNRRGGIGRRIGKAFAAVPWTPLACSSEPRHFSSPLCAI